MKIIDFIPKKEKSKQDPNLGHVWKWNGDVKQCHKCKKYLGLWDGITPCK